MLVDQLDWYVAISDTVLQNTNKSSKKKYDSDCWLRYGLSKFEHLFTELEVKRKIKRVFHIDMACECFDKSGKAQLYRPKTISLILGTICIIMDSFGKF